MTLITKMGFCPGCMMTQKVMDAKHIKYTVKHLSNATEKAHVKDLGFRSYPIVLPSDKFDDKVWSGFRPEKIAEYDE